MSRLFLLNKINTKKHRQRKRFYHQLKITRQKISILLILFIVIIGLSYLVQTNSIAAKDFQIRELRNRVDILRQEDRMLEARAAELQSQAMTELSQQGLDMVKADKVDYLSAAETIVAVK